MKTISILICFFLSLTILSAQNYLFDSGQSGFHLSAQFTSNDGSTVFALAPGYTANGKATFGVAIGSENNNNLDITSTAIKPFLNYLVVRQGENDMPISVAVGGAYQYNTFKDLDLTASAISFGLSIIHQIEAAHNLDIFPTGSVGWGKTTFSSSGFEEDLSAISYGLSATFLFAKKFYVDPILSFSDGDSSFSLSIGMLFP